MYETADIGLPEAVEEATEPSEWKLTIIKTSNGFYLKEANVVIEEVSEDELGAIENMTYEVWNYFGYYGSKHDKERLFVERRKQHE
jgi:hypothetical protein